MILSSGSTGPSVKKVQETLNYLDVSRPPLAVDGIFGPKTQSAVVTFQKIAKLPTDGIVGPQTAQALASAVFKSLITGE